MSKIDIYTVHNATVCRFRQNALDTFMAKSFVKNRQNAASSVCFFANKVVGNIHHIYSIRFTNVSLKLQGLLKFKHFGS